MKKIILLILLTGVMALFSRPAFAEYEDGDRIPQEIIAPLMAWVEAQTGVRVSMLPHVVASRSKLMYVVSKMGRISGRAKALYIGGTVILDHRYFDSEDSTQLSLLVHELVHYAQSFRRTSWRCAQEKEMEAYTLQNRWLQEQGHASFVSVSWIKRMAMCPVDLARIASARSW